MNKALGIKITLTGLNDTDLTNLIIVPSLNYPLHLVDIRKLKKGKCSFLSPGEVDILERAVDGYLYLRAEMGSEITIRDGYVSGEQ